MTVGSLFSGIGGLDLGLEWAGMKVVWQCEKDEFCRRVLAKHWPGVRCYEDVREVGADAAKVDVIVGGFPCQPHSLAGKRKGAADDRDLWPEFRRVVAELQPTWVVGENVPGIYGPFLDGVLADLEDLSYRALVFEIPACAVDAPHRRARVFIVAHSHGWGREDERCSSVHDGIRPSLRHDANGRGEPGGVGDAEGSNGRTGHSTAESGRIRRRRPDDASAWGDAEWLACGDGKVRRVKPGVRLLAHGIPGRMDKLRALGNAVVPQVAEVIGRMIVVADQGGAE